MNRLAVIANPDKPPVAAALERVIEWAKSRGIHVDSDFESNGATPSDTIVAFDVDRLERLRARFAGADYAITLGGDGTLLHGAQIVAPLGMPVLSVNLGSLGFHTQVAPEHLLDQLEAVRAGNFRIERRLLLEARLLPGEADHDAPENHSGVLALNDIVISRSSWGRMVHLRVFINGQPLTDLFADGLLVATPTGSSAYNYAAGGPVLQPDLEAIILNAICPHRMNFSPVVVSASTEVVIDFRPRKQNEEAQLLVDGQAWQSISLARRLKISRAPVYLPLIVFEHDFFQKLRDKLAWGGLT